MSSAVENNVDDRKKIWQCVDTYQMALNLPTNCSECKFLIHKDLLKCYNKMESLSQMVQIKLYFFDMELESIDRILYYKGANHMESRVLINKGSTYFSRLRLLLGDETSENKAQYLEKVFVGMNALNADFRSRIAWQISKAYMKQAIQ